jgi:hypothetical protein
VPISLSYTTPAPQPHRRPHQPPHPLYDEKLRVCVWAQALAEAKHLQQPLGVELQEAGGGVLRLELRNRFAFRTLGTTPQVPIGTPIQL